jgi:hypothetical protein
MHLARPFVDQRRRLEQGYPFIFIKIQVSEKEPTTQINLTFFVENNSIDQENSRWLEFYKNTPKLFWNYILVHVILYLGPYLTFYNYN